MNMTLNANAKLIDNKMKFECTAGGEYKIVTDYMPPYGSGQGPTSLELFLASLCSCLGGTFAVLLRQAGKKVDGIFVSAHGKRREEHPTCFESICITAKIKSADAQQEDIKKALELAEQSICPVAAMIKGNVLLSIEAELV
jgi:putative redox protein